MKTAEILFVNGSSMRQDYRNITTDGEWLHFTGRLASDVFLSVSSRAVLYIEHDVGA